MAAGVATDEGVLFDLVPKLRLGNEGNEERRKRSISDKVENEISDRFDSGQTKGGTMMFWSSRMVAVIGVSIAMAILSAGRSGESAEPTEVEPADADALASATPAQYLGKPVSYWIQRLRHPRSECSTKAAWVLGRMGAGAKPAVPDLIKKIGDSDFEAQIAAINTLGVIAPHAQAAIPKLAEFINGEDHPGRRLAAMVLGRMRAEGETVVPVLVKTLDDEQWWVREGAAYGLGMFAAKVPLGAQAQPVVSALGKMLDDESTEVRWAALYALWSIGPAAESTLKKARESGHADVGEIAALALKAVGPKANTTLESVIADEKADLEIRQWAFMALPWDTPQLPAMKKTLGYSDPKLRSLATYALGAIGPKSASAVPALTRLLHDESQDVRRAAIYALGEVGPEAKSAIPELAKMLHQTARDDETRDEEPGAAPPIVLALWKIGPDAVPVLVQALRSVKDQDTADEIIGCLALLGSAAVSPLQELLEDQNPKVGVRAAWALALMGTEAQSAVPAMQQAVRNAAPDDKIHMLGALAEILTDSPYGRQVKQGVQQMWKLKQVGLAMQNYHDTFRRFPSAAWSKDGKPLLSWRVALLPYVEQAALYDKFHLDEPWDSPHNVKLLTTMPDVYHCGGRKKDGKTAMMVFTGGGAAFHGSKAFGVSQIGDGLSNTIMVVVAGPDQAVPWTKPEDLPFDPQDPIAAMGEVPEIGFPAVLFDGSTLVLSKTIDPKRLRGLITPDGGEIATVHER